MATDIFYTEIPLTLKFGIKTNNMPKKSGITWQLTFFPLGFR